MLTSSSLASGMVPLLTYAVRFGPKYEGPEISPGIDIYYRETAIRKI
jgi:hypothetical protein